MASPSHPIFGLTRSLEPAPGKRLTRRAIDSDAIDSPLRDRTTDASSPLFDLLLPLQTITARFHRISIPGNFNPPANTQAFFPLRVFTAAADMVFFGARWQLCAGNIASATIGEPAWGDATGSSAALVAVRQKFAEKTWVGTGLCIDGLDRPGTTGQTMIEPDGGGPELLWYVHTPPGDFASSNGAPVLSGSYSTLPAGQLIRAGESVSVGLAMRQNYVANLGSAGTIIGRGFATLNFVTETGINRRSR
jgi:hypothetical protein